MRDLGLRVWKRPFLGNTLAHTLCRLLTDQQRRAQLAESLTKDHYGKSLELLGGIILSGTRKPGQGCGRRRIHDEQQFSASTTDNASETKKERRQYLLGSRHNVSSCLTSKVSTVYLQRPRTT